MKTHRALGHKTLAAVLAPHALFFALNFADDEIPAGVRNGRNCIFTLKHAPNPPASLQLYLNGIALHRSAQGDYTLKSNTITLAASLAPDADVNTHPMLAWYRY